MDLKYFICMKYLKFILLCRRGIKVALEKEERREEVEVEVSIHFWIK